MVARPAERRSRFRRLGRVRRRGHCAAVQIAAIRQLGARVRERRDVAGLTQAQFAARCDLDRLYLGRLERGAQNPTMLVVARIAVELSVTLAELFDGIEVDADEVRAVKRLPRGPRAG